MGEGNWEKSGKIGKIGKTTNVPELQESCREAVQEMSRKSRNAGEKSLDGRGQIGGNLVFC